MANVETALERVTISGEGPHWDERTGQLNYVDINAYSVCRWTAKTGLNERHTFDDFCSLVIPRESGGHVIGLGKSIRHFDWETKQTTEVLAIVDKDKETRINDGKCDAKGRLWFGTMGLEKKAAIVEPEQGSLFSLDIDGTVRTHKSGLSISNGMAWTTDNKTMFFIDSIPRKLWAYDFDLATGTISNERTVLHFTGEDTIPTLGLPDGMTIDRDGKIWVACFFAGRIVRYDPETGQELDHVKVPAIRTTSCCFGGKNYDELYITCCRPAEGSDELTNTPLAGSIFRATGLGTCGSPAYMFRG